MKDFNDLINDLEGELVDTSTTSETLYEIWALGYDENDEVTGAELLMCEFKDPDEAVEFAKALSLSEVLLRSTEDMGCDIFENPPPSAYISVEVETVISSEDSYFNVGTIYRKKLFLNVPPGIILDEDAFEVTEEGIRISKQVFDDFVKDSYIDISFGTNEVIPYKMLSEDDDWIYCDILY